jgi:signal transduction histidine kinase
MPQAVLPREHFHPLEIIPYFRRWPRSAGRDLLYTFLWSSLFGLAMFAVSIVTSATVPSMRVLGIQMLIANAIGYAIHALFWAGDRLQLDLAVRKAGFLPKVAYYTLVPMLGVLVGFEIASLLLDQQLMDWVTRPGMLVSVLLTSLIISVVLSLIFFWRERSASAEAATAQERARMGHIQREAALANLRALQAQIEPHFLFNTLANVTSLIDPDPAKAKHMLESFIRFLRASLAATRAETTTLGEEAELIGAYLEVLQVRMGPRLRWRIDVPQELRGLALAPMLVQPVVENAIRHGLEPKVEGGEVTLRMRREGDRVRIEVADTGVGFHPATRGGVGLANIRERLRALYGDAGRLEIEDNAAAGARVSLTVPA